MNASELVFAYGSNVDPAQMRERCPESDLSRFIAEARSWRLYFPRESKKRKGGVGSIVRSANDSVWGVVFSVTKRDLTRLDLYLSAATTEASFRVADDASQLLNPPEKDA